MAFNGKQRTCKSVFLWMSVDVVDPVDPNKEIGYQNVRIANRVQKILPFESRHLLFRNYRFLRFVLFENVKLCNAAGMCQGSRNNELHREGLGGRNDKSRCLHGK